VARQAAATLLLTSELVSLHFINPEASPVLQYPASPSVLSPLPEEFSLLGTPHATPSLPSPPTILIAETFDLEVFEVPNSSRTLQSPSPFVLNPPGSPVVEETHQFTDILGNLIGPSLPPWCKAALSGTPSSNTFEPSTRSLPLSPPHWTPTPDSPINYEAVALRVAEYEAILSPALQFPTIAPALPDPWDNLCPDANGNPHQYLAIQTGIPIKEKSSAFLWLGSYFTTHQTSLLSSLSLRPSTTIRPSPPLLPLSSDFQQELTLLSKLADKQFKLNHHWTSL